MLAGIVLVFILFSSRRLGYERLQSEWQSAKVFQDQLVSGVPLVINEGEGDGEITPSQEGKNSSPSSKNEVLSIFFMVLQGGASPNPAQVCASESSADSHSFQFLGAAGAAPK